MQLFGLKQKDNKLDLEQEIFPIRFRDIPMKHGNTKEDDIMDLIVKHPELLNCDENQDDPELLIISRQLITQTKKRADFVAIDKDGYLITIEVKRDREDEKRRSESMEFQSIRYAASHRTLNVDGIIRTFAQYLSLLEKQKNKKLDKTIEDFIPEATQKICKHLSAKNDEEIIQADDLSEYIDPTERQKIYLVASDFAEDCLSACAWLREHKINIYCFKLQPYRINEVLVLHQERLIPPTALDDFYVGTKEAKEQARKQPRNSSVPPTKLLWQEEEIVCHTWYLLLKIILKKSLEMGYVEKDLPFRYTTDKNEADEKFNGSEMVQWNYNGQENSIYIDKYRSKKQVFDAIKKILEPNRKKLSYVMVELLDGTSENLLE